MQTYFNKKNKLLVIILLCITVTCGILLNITYKASATERNIDSNLSKINKVLNDLYTNKDVLLESSNPYDYIDDSRIKPMYQDMVSQGVDSIPLLIEKINNSSENGLNEYILAIAAEEVGKTSLNELGQDFKWSNSKSWSKSIENHLSKVEENYYKILNSSDSKEVKATKIKKLGVYVIPYIMDSIKEDDTDLISVVDDLSDNSDTKYNNSSANFKTWKNEKIKKYKGLKTVYTSVK